MNKKVISVIVIGVILISTILVLLFFWPKNQPKINPAKMPDEKKNIIPESKIFNPNVVYLRGDEIILYDFLNKKKKVILKSDKLIDYNVSNDKKFIAYSLKEDGFQGNSDIYIKNIDTEEVIRLTENNNIASINPVIFPKNDKVAYVRRNYDPIAKKMSDGEIWVINSDGNEKSSKKLIDGDSKNKFALLESDKIINENGKWTGDYYCISQEEADSVKIGIDRIGLDGEKIAYWKLDWAPECSGTSKIPFFANIDGSDFFTEKFKKQNIAEKKYSDSEKIWKVSWDISNIFWLENGDFIVNNWQGPPLTEYATYYYDKEQNKKYAIYDSTENDSSKNEIHLKYVKFLPKKEVALFYEIYIHENDKPRMGIIETKLLMQKFKIDESITINKLISGILINKGDYYEIDSIKNFEVISDNIIAYEKRGRDGKNSDIYAFDLENKKEDKMDDLFEN